MTQKHNDYPGETYETYQLSDDWDEAEEAHLQKSLALTLTWKGEEKGNNLPIHQCSEEAEYWMQSSSPPATNTTSHIQIECELA